jgi:hypothetical protein
VRAKQESGTKLPRKVIAFEVLGFAFEVLGLAFSRVAPTRFGESGTKLPRKAIAFEVLGLAFEVLGLAFSWVASTRSGEHACNAKAANRSGHQEHRRWERFAWKMLATTGTQYLSMCVPSKTYDLNPSVKLNLVEFTTPIEPCAQSQRQAVLVVHTTPILLYWYSNTTGVSLVLMPQL